MKLLIHKNSKTPVRVISSDTEEVILTSISCTGAFWELAERYPAEIIGWCEVGLARNIDTEKMNEIFHHDLIMASYSVTKKFLGGEIGYVDQLPFINVKSGVKYPTWRMSSDVGGIKAKTLLEFQKLFGHLSNFDYLLNSISKVGQQNGLFCYSDPRLINKVQETELRPTSGNNELFSFVFQHYKSIWVFILFFCLVKYERRIPFMALLHSLLRPKFFQKDIDLSDIKIASGNVAKFKNSIDVIIPTIGRAEYVAQVVVDLSLQSFLPKKVIIVEQQPEKNLKTELQDLLIKDWPFEIVHIFTNKTGACMARNKGLEKVESEWIFFADDDIRLEKNVLADTLKEARRLKLDCINLNCKQPGEDTVFHKMKQWGSFGSGTSVVRSNFVEELRFSEVFEHGYGEDVDFGMKLREKGCDIIYHPTLEIQHLKAPIGGFREKPVLAWEKEIPKPKPSPTIMLLANRYYTPQQMKGFKISLYLKHFRNQNNINPFTYIKNMNGQWKKSVEWAEKLEIIEVIP